MAAAISKFVVVVLRRVLMTAQEGVTTKRCFVRRLHMDAPEVDAPLVPGAVPLVSSVPCPTGVLVLLPGRMVDVILDFGVCDIVDGSRIETGRSLLALYMSRKVE